MNGPQRVLITGASKGIGRAAMQQLAQAGLQPIGLARTTPADAQEGERFVECDMSDLKATTQVLADLVREGPFYGLVNNVGVAHTSSLANCSVDEMSAAMMLNVNTALVCMQALMPGMIDAHAGRVINISSRAALGKQNRTAYSASKAAMIGMTRTWALELAANNITVNAIAPGPIATELFNQASPPESAQTKALMASVPLQRIGKPEEVAHAIAFLLHPLSGYITGQTLHIDGGLTISNTRL